ncbi:cytochrome P450 [Histidinibacterium lentulum]|uniref:Cytochrome P450 n=1 Tax=Histidinibacterium lentulum TaxID=2480588 RepID=A0A3N2R5E8_9RHOB|nr:cytochrome P450 [Histidinibacterium lentulum]ROU02581.1 cytochrome P450 [Histidinibacterium lentulum]
MTNEDPFAPYRDAGGYLGDFRGERIPVILGYHAVRDAAKDWQRFSNDAQGRVPIPAEDDVRSLRQLPIETDPPLHTELKDLVRDWFRRPATDPALREAITVLVAEAVEKALAAGEVEVVSGFALPLQSRALALLLGLPRAAGEEWIAWGLHAFRTAGVNDPARADRLLKVLERETDRAMAQGGDDFFAFLAGAEFRGRKLTRDEILGYAHVTFAGGRDTLIASIATALRHMAQRPEDLKALRHSNRLAVTGAEEIVRWLSPLDHIGRICPHADEVGGHPRAPGERIALCWAAANHDPAVFADAQTLRLDRSPNPHVGYGAGDHACLGASHARAVIRAVLTETAARAGRIDLVEEAPDMRDIGGVVHRRGYARLTLRFHRKDD